MENPREFVFIDGSARSAAAREAIKVHVAQENHRTKQSAQRVFGTNQNNSRSHILLPVIDRRHMATPGVKFRWRTDVQNKEQESCEGMLQNLETLQEAFTGSLGDPFLLHDRDDRVTKAHVPQEFVQNSPKSRQADAQPSDVPSNGLAASSDGLQSLRDCKGIPSYCRHRQGCIKRSCYQNAKECLSKQAQSRSRPQSRLQIQRTTNDDPFSSTALPITSKVYYYLESWAKALVTVNMLDQNAAAPTWTPKMLSDRAWFHATLAFSAAHLVGATIGRTAHPTLHMIMCIEHKVAAMKYINQKLQSNDTMISDAAIMAVSLLANTEMLLGQFRELNAHVAGVKRMVELRGGISALSPELVFHLTVFDNKSNVLFLSGTNFPAPVIPDLAPGKHLMKIKPVKANLSVFGSRFFTSHLTSSLNPYLVGNLQELSTLTRSWNVCTQDYFKPDFHYGFNLLTKELAVETRLLNLPDQERYWTQLSPLNECCRIACFILVNTGFFIPPGIVLNLEGLGQAMASSTAAFLAMDSWQSSFMLDVLLCCQFLGAYISPDPVNRDFFASKIAAVASILDLSSWANVEEVLKPTFYIDHVHSRSFRSIWDESQVRVKDACSRSDEKNGKGNPTIS